MAADPTPALMQVTDMIVFVRRGTAAPEITTILTRRQAGRDGAIQLETAYET